MQTASRLTSTLKSWPLFFVCVFDKLKYSDYPVDRCRLIVAFVAVEMFFSEKKVPSERDDIEFERQKV